MVRCGAGFGRRRGDGLAERHLGGVSPNAWHDRDDRDSVRLAWIFASGVRWVGSSFGLVFQNGAFSGLCRANWLVDAAGAGTVGSCDRRRVRCGAEPDAFRRGGSFCGR